ncbi:conserved hypothetical protein [Ricinus communis]|uniref:Uncharacterized protein n=1 Tax=Ricinus communis TaxID=3988 RepID=B9T2D8_RICCO|nr:conserved hypothetical protein [Ricinus communis]
MCLGVEATSDINYIGLIPFIACSEWGPLNIERLTHRGLSHTLMSPSLESSSIFGSSRSILGLALAEACLQGPPLLKGYLFLTKLILRVGKINNNSCTEYGRIPRYGHSGSSSDDDSHTILSRVGEVSTAHATIKPETKPGLDKIEVPTPCMAFPSPPWIGSDPILAIKLLPDSAHLPLKLGGPLRYMEGGCPCNRGGAMSQATFKLKARNSKVFRLKVRKDSMVVPLLGLNPATFLVDHPVVTG